MDKAGYHSVVAANGIVRAGCLTKTCRRHDMNPKCSLTRLLENPSTTFIVELPASLPDQWKLTHSGQATP
jgi:hypothetical protein